MISGRRARSGGDRSGGAASAGKAARPASRARRFTLRALPVAAAASMVALAVPAAPAAVGHIRPATPEPALGAPGLTGKVHPGPLKTSKCLASLRDPVLHATSVPQRL